MTPSPSLVQIQSYISPTVLTQSRPSRGILPNWRHTAKVLNSEFICVHVSNPHPQNHLIDSQEIFTQTAQGSRQFKSEIKS